MTVEALDEHRSRVGRELRERIAQLDGADGQEAPFPAAAAFLRGLQVLCRGRHGFHLGGRRHVHLYFGDAFLLYLRIEGLEEGRPSLLLSERPHGQLKLGTLDASHLLFRKRIHRVLATLGLEHDKRLMRGRGGYRALPGVPEAFFQLIHAQLIDIVQSGEQAQMAPQPTLFALAPVARKPRARREPAPDAGSPDAGSPDAAAPGAALPGAAPERPAPPATVALAADIDRSLATLRELLGQRLGAPVELTLGPDGVTLTWREGDTVRQEAGWQLASLVAEL